jgi:hypothetical protein
MARVAASALPQEEPVLPKSAEIYLDQPGVHVVAPHSAQMPANKDRLPSEPPMEIASESAQTAVKRQPQASSVTSTKSLQPEAAIPRGSATPSNENPVPVSAPQVALDLRVPETSPSLPRVVRTDPAKRPSMEQTDAGASPAPLSRSLQASQRTDPQPGDVPVPVVKPSLPSVFAAEPPHSMPKAAQKVDLRPSRPAANILERVLALGHATATKQAILSSPPVIPDELDSKYHPATPTAPPPSADTPTPDLAFSMRLSVNPIEPPPYPQPVVPAALPPMPAPAPADPVPSAPPLTPAAAPATAPAKPDRARSEDEPAPDHVESRSATTPAPRLAAQIHVESVAPPVRKESALQTEPSRPTHPSEAVPPEASAAPKPAGAARDIKLQLAGVGPQRVDVHLTERAGQVQVAVRTPDSHLAGALRENLPTLSARLADSGIRSETWHPSAPATEWHRTAETSRPNLAQDHNPQSGGQHQEQQSGGDPRRPKVPEAPMERKEKGKDFSWFMSTLQ